MHNDLRPQHLTGIPELILRRHAENLRLSAKIRRKAVKQLASWLAQQLEKQ